MSRLKLFEERLQDLSDKEHLIHLIYKDCQPFLKKALKDNYQNLFYSGRKSKDDWFKGNVRTDRRPTDTNKVLHRDLDKMFQKKFGYLVRSSSIFVTNDIGVADSYGTTYMIFPIGNFKFVWSPGIVDLYIYMRDEYGTKSKENNGVLDAVTWEVFNDAGNERDEFMQYYDEWMKEGGPNGYWIYEDDDVELKVPKGKTHKQAIVWIKEKADDYRASGISWYPDMDLDEFHVKYFKEWSTKRSERLNILAKDKYYHELKDIVMMYTDKDFDAAIQSKHEIMLNCKQYYAVKYDNYYLLRDVFLKNGVKYD